MRASSRFIRLDIGSVDALAAAIAHANTQTVAQRLAGELDELAVRLVLNDGGACLRDRELHVLDLLDREVNAIRYRRRCKPRERNPFGARRYAELDDLG